MEQKKNNQDVYLSPQSVSSRIRSINEEIKSRIRMNQEGVPDVHEVTARRYKESLKEEESKEGSKGESKISSKEETRVDKDVYSRVDKDNVSPTVDSISVDSRLSSYRGSTVCSIGHTKTNCSPLTKSTPPLKSTDGRVRELVDNYSMRIPKKEGKNPFKTPTTNPFFVKNKNPFSSSVKDSNVENGSVKDSSNKSMATISPSIAPSTTPSISPSTTTKSIDLSVLSLNPHSSYSSYSSKPFKPITLTPINVLYSPKHFYVQEKRVDSPPTRRPFNKTLSTPLSLYGPGEELRECVRFSLLNTVYVFEKGVEDTVYFLRVESTVSWTIRKSLSQIRHFLKTQSEGSVLSSSNILSTTVSFNPYDKKVRDNVILTLLNTLGEQEGNTQTLNDLQLFILTNITKEKDLRSNYLLMEEEPYNFRLVGQALVCYDKTNRVKKLFLLKGCTVEVHNEYSFRIRDSVGDSGTGDSVILYCSCSMERDSWINDIQEFIDNK